MGRVFLAVFVLVLLVVIGGMLVLGAFPPQPRTEQIQRLVPNDKFQTR